MKVGKFDVKQNKAKSVTAVAAVVWCREEGPKMQAPAVMQGSFIVEGENNKSKDRTKHITQTGETNDKQNPKP